MTNDDLSFLAKIQRTIKDCTKKSEAYLSVQDSLSEDLKVSTKNLYDLAIKNKPTDNSKSNVLPELIIEDFDAEQIWQQLELKNNEEFSRINLGNISKALASKNQVDWELPLKVINDAEPEESKKSQESDDPDVDGNEESNSEDENIDDMDLEEDENIDDMDLEEDDEDTSRINSKPKKSVTFEKKRITKPTVVDDKFFKLDQLDEFLQKEDKKEFESDKTKRKFEESDSEDEDDESIDLFDEADNDIEEEDEEGIKAGRSLKYIDFFDSPDSDGENASYEKDVDGEENDDDDDEFSGDDNMSENENEKEEDYDNEMYSDESDDDLENKNKIETKSSLESRKERLQKRIQQLETEAISDKPWQLKGEASALIRPKDSLLQEFVEFDQVSRPAPLMTEQTTMKLEDIIRKRIKDKVWDDVEKKFKPVETPLEYKKKLVMNQEKSKESLAQIYENEYIKQRDALNTEDKEEQEKEEPPEHIEIQKSMHDLFRKLDALTNFHYTPKLAKPEIKIVSNVPAISMEEVAPVATSDATLLAPEEVKAKRKGELIGETERTKTDMKRARRKKKLKQHAKAVHESTKTDDKVTLKTLKKKKNKKPIVKGRNIINADQENGKHDGKAIKSSTAFFAHLQDQVQSTIKAKTSASAPKKNKNRISAVKLKL